MTEKEEFEHDERIFETKLKEWGVNCKPIKSIVLDNGLGDHLIFKSLLPDLKRKYKDHEIVAYVCYPQVFENDNLILKSIHEAQQDFGDLNQYNLYAFMDSIDHKGEVTDAYKKLYKI